MTMSVCLSVYACVCVHVCMCMFECRLASWWRSVVTFKTCRKDGLPLAASTIPLFICVASSCVVQSFSPGLFSYWSSKLGSGWATKAWRSPIGCKTASLVIKSATLLLLASEESPFRYPLQQITTDSFQWN